MILSLSIIPERKLDVFSLFSLSGAIVCPSEVWFQCFMASLQNRHSVFVRSRSEILVPEINFRERWLVGEGHIWISPHGRGPITQMFQDAPITFDQFIIRLSLVNSL